MIQTKAEQRLRNMLLERGALTKLSRDSGVPFWRLRLMARGARVHLEESAEQPRGHPMTPALLDELNDAENRADLYRACALRCWAMRMLAEEKEDEETPEEETKP